MDGKEKKILIIVYYWPPSGGSGVQRWVKLSKYLAKSGIEVHVLTVDEQYASYMQKDLTLAGDIHPNIKIYKTKSFEAINIFAKIFGRKKVPTAGFYNLDRKSVIHNIGLIIRSNIFIPDPRRGWNKYALKKASEIIKNHGIRTVITSTPPHSSQLVGLSLKNKFNIRWIADLRDPWTDIFYYPLLRHSFLSRSIDQYYEKKVLVKSDLIFTVSQNLEQVFQSKSKKINPDKFFIIPNGYDEEDFKNVVNSNKNDDFIIGYTGTLTEQYHPNVFFKAFARFVKITSGIIKLEITGTISNALIELAKNSGLDNYLEVNPSVSHAMIPSLLTGKSALLLVIPNVNNAGGILTGKLFEYLAANRPIILIGPKVGDAAKIISECKAGHSFDWNDEEGILQYLLFLKNQHEKNIPFKSDNDKVREYSREKQAKRIKNLLFPAED